MYVPLGVYYSETRTLMNMYVFLLDLRDIILRVTVKFIDIILLMNMNIVNVDIGHIIKKK